MSVINLEINRNLDGSKPYMGMAFIDSYRDVLLKELKLADIDPNNPDGDHWDNYFTVCPACKLPVVDSSIVPDSGGICDHCVNKAKGITRPDPEPTMMATLTDSWGDKLILYLTVDEAMGGTAKFETADYFMPCAHCGNPVLNQSVEKQSDCCIRCETGNYTMSPITYIKSGVGTGPTREDMLNMLLIHKLPEDVMTMEQRIKVARQEAEDAFWEVIVKHFPEATDGSFLMSDMDDIMLSWVEHWVDCNVPKPRIPSNRPESNEKPEEWAERLNLNYKDIWHNHQTGGGCMVVCSDNVVADGIHKFISVTSEVVVINEDTFKEDEWLQVEQERRIWSFTDNPTVLMNILEEEFGNNVLFDNTQLFHDLYRIGTSDVV